ncbi:transmembrane protein, putative (macronuclear) [Tetrahymena thermophila SB210]|uniref:Transmembrane protein, putative n=1 Tax=Tetrahymena thermophila (strain SB210) TaxID=312017 RepID=W7XDJ6_TETTS|nr:transmembrane protein, putative [Tetrahymena thermophila SB210]EWS74718.1 transmembrane protein, putative [Tetrahymena thermophila SB210]|eukprot:XP_012652719.1 transmembrane protein, putative [Tetrahymena thermophila SB210]
MIFKIKQFLILFKQQLKKKKFKFMLLFFNNFLQHENKYLSQIDFELQYHQLINFNLLAFFYVFSLFIQLIILFSTFAFIINQLINQSYYFIFFSSFFPSNQLFNDTFFLQYLKSYNIIGDDGASGLGFGLANCINLSNLTLNLLQKQLFAFDWDIFNYRNQLKKNKALFSFSFNCTYFFLFFLCQFKNSSFYFQLLLLLLINKSYLLFHIFSSFIPSNQLFNDIFFLQYLKSSNKIGDKGASGLGSGLANCINLSNLTLHLGFSRINKLQKFKVLKKCLKSKRLVVFNFK